MGGPRRFVDLHTHSTASDGSLPPAQVILAAEGRKLAAVALTDHDTIAGLEAASRAAAGLEVKFVPGIEVSARWPGGTLHLLGLGIDPFGEGIRKLSAGMLQARSDRNPRMLARLRELGIAVEMSDLLAMKGPPGGAGAEGVVVGRLHMAQLLVARGAVRTVKEAFDRYLGPGGAAYVDKERLDPRDVIAAIKSSGGLAVLAHPVQLGCANAAQLQRVVKDFADLGLDGIEAYHTDHDDRMTRRCMDLARQFGLGVTGGSDFHGQGKPEATLGKPPVPVAVLTERFRQRLLGM